MPLELTIQGEERLEELRDLDFSDDNLSGLGKPTQKDFERLLLAFLGVSL